MAKNQQVSKESKKPNIVIIDNKEIDRIYSNYVSVTTTPHECNLTFCHIDPLEKSPSRINAHVVAKIMIPNTLVEEVLAVIQKNFNTVMQKLSEAQAKK